MAAIAPVGSEDEPTTHDLHIETEILNQPAEIRLLGLMCQCSLRHAEKHPRSIGLRHCRVTCGP